MRSLPGMTVINTCDFNQTKAATMAIADWEGQFICVLVDPKCQFLSGNAF